MNRNGRLFRRTVIIVIGLHIFVIFLVGFPIARCSKPALIRPVEIIDLGSLRPGPGLPSPIVSTSPAPTQNQEPKIQNQPPPKPEPIQNQPKEEPTPTPDIKPEPKPEIIKNQESKIKTPPIPNPQPAIPPKHQVKVSTTKTKATSASSSETKTSASKSTALTGPSSSDIKNRLNSKITGEAGGGGGDGSGMAGRPDGVANDFSWYRALIKQSIESSWKKPPIPGGETIYTEVEIKISFDGTMTFLTITHPSGNPAMDTSVEQAVRSIGRLPKPLPAGLGSPDYIVIIQFKLE